MAANATTINIYGKYNSVVIANALTIDIHIFNQLNPSMDATLAKGDIYPLRFLQIKQIYFSPRKMKF